MENPVLFPSVLNSCDNDACPKLPEGFQETDRANIRESGFSRLLGNCAQELVTPPGGYGLLFPEGGEHCVKSFDRGVRPCLDHICRQA